MRQKHRTARYVISLNELQQDALEKTMKKYLQTNVSEFFGMLLTEKYLSEQPKKKTDMQKADDENLSIYPHPTVPNIMLNRSELEAFYQLRGQKVPSGTFDNDL